MTDEATVAAWAAVHANTPAGWFVGQPGYEERYGQWSMHAFDPSEKAMDGGRGRQWTAVGRTKLECVQEMARCHGELKAGRWPK